MAEHTPQRAASRWETWRKRYALVSDILTPQRLAMAALGLVLLGAGAVGGWDAAVTTEDDIPRVEASATAPAAPFELIVKKAFQGSELKPALGRQDGVRYVFVTLDATNTSDRPAAATLLINGVTIDTQGLKAGKPRLLRVLDGQDAQALSPDVAVPAVLVWEQDASTAAPTVVTVTVSGHTWRRAVLDSSVAWRDPAPAFRVTLPVQPVPEG